MAFAALLIADDAAAQFFVPVYIPAQRQDSDVRAKWSNGNTLSAGWKGSYSQSLVAWKGHKLTWDDFEGRALHTTDKNYILSVNYVNRPYIERTKIGNTTYEYYMNESLFNKADSWVADTCRNDATLKLAQADFNLWELNSRRMVAEYNTFTNVTYDELGDFYLQRFRNSSEEIREATDNGRNEQKLQEVCDSLDIELLLFHYNPAASVSGLTEKNGYYLDLGIASHFPFSEYVSPAYFGIDFEVGGFVRRSMIGLDMRFGFGSKCHKDIWSKEGTIHNGESVTSGTMLLVYGLKMMEGEKYAITPYVGAGVNFYAGGRKDLQYQNDKGNERVEKAGFSLGVGCIFDLIFSRKVYIRTQTDGISKQVRGMSIKPYFSFTQYGGDLNLVPAFNIAVCWDMKAFKLKGKTK